MKKSEKKVVNPKFAQTERYRKILSVIESENKCPFCPNNFKYHKNPILKRLGDWFITENSWSYKEARHRFLLICDKHMENISELSAKDLETVLKLAKWATRKYRISGGALAMRFGNTRFTGATVCHLHFHLISPKVDKKENTKVVYFPIG